MVAEGVLDMADSVAEMFFLTAVDETSGRQHVRTDLLYSGVVGGVLADLALARCLRVDEGGLVLLTSVTRRTVTDLGAAYLVEAVARQNRTFSVRRWIEETGPAVFELVCRGLVEGEVIRREQVGKLRRHDVYPPANRVAAATPRMALTRMLRDPRQFTLRLGVVAVLVEIAGLDATFSADLNRAKVREITAELTAHLPRDLRTITDGVRTVASNRALTPQR